MKVLVLTGPESAGKSWLAQEIQQHFGGCVVGEYVRYFIDQHQRDTCYADIDPIARGQLAWEDEARAQRPPLLILDTHLLSNILWSRLLFGQVPAWLEQELLARHYDLHLLLDPRDVPWIADGQRCQPQLADRLAFYHHCQDWLTSSGLTYQSVGGDWSSRRDRTLALVAELLGRKD